MESLNARKMRMFLCGYGFLAKIASRDFTKYGMLLRSANILSKNRGWSK
jgi:hypothetical protein